MKKFAVIIWVLLSLAPIFYIPYMMVGMSAGFSEDSTDSFDKTFNTMLALNMLMLVLLASFIFYLYRSDNVPKSKRGLWVAVLLLGNSIAMPFFWYWYVWTPLKKENRSNLGETYRPSKVVPIFMGLAMLSMMPITIALMKYQEAKASEFIAEAFPISLKNQNLDEITSGKISISKKLAARHTRYFHKSMTIYASNNSVVFKPSSIFSFHKPFEIPATAIHSCSKQCGEKNQWGQTRLISD